MAIAVPAKTLKMMTMRYPKTVFIKILMVLGFIAAAVESGHADIYKYIDSNGVLHFTNVPTSSNYRLYIKERPWI